MPAISDAEIAPGLVVFLDLARLHRSPRVLSTLSLAADMDRDMRPVLCIHREGDVSVWVPLTSVFRRERVHLPPSTKRGGLSQWRREDTYLNDVRRRATAYNDVIVRMSAGERTERNNRSRITTEGVNRARIEMGLGPLLLPTTQ